MSTYEKKTWVNNETKVNATNMNHIEEGIYTNSVEIEELKNDKQDVLIPGANIIIENNTISGVATNYPNLPAEEGGTSESIVTTGEKFFWNNKQDALTFDIMPMLGSNNPVTSAGIKNYVDQGLEQKANKNGFIYEPFSASTLTARTLIQIDDGSGYYKLKIDYSGISNKKGRFSQIYTFNWPTKNGTFALLEDIPTVPTKTSELTNDSGYLVLSDLDDFALKSWVQDQHYLSNVSWDIITGKPTFASVATSGNYNDLINKPNIPTKTSDLTNDSNFVSDASYVHTDNNFTNSYKAQIEANTAKVSNVKADWNANSGEAQILNKPDLAQVATSGDYDDLSNKIISGEGLKFVNHNEIRIDRTVNRRYRIYADDVTQEDTIFYFKGNAAIAIGSMDGTIEIDGYDFAAKFPSLGLSSNAIYRFIPSNSSTSENNYLYCSYQFVSAYTTITNTLHFYASFNPSTGEISDFELSLSDITNFTFIPTDLKTDNSTLILYNSEEPCQVGSGILTSSINGDPIIGDEPKNLNFVKNADDELEKITWGQEEFKVNAPYLVQQNDVVSVVDPTHSGSSTYTAKVTFSERLGDIIKEGKREIIFPSNLANQILGTNYGVEFKFIPLSNNGIMQDTPWDFYQILGYFSTHMDNYLINSKEEFTIFFDFRDHYQEEQEDIPSKISSNIGYIICESKNFIYNLFDISFNVSIQNLRELYYNGICSINTGHNMDIPYGEFKLKMTVGGEEGNIARDINFSPAGMDVGYLATSIIPLTGTYYSYSEGAVIDQFTFPTEIQVYSRLLNKVVNGSQRTFVEILRIDKPSFTLELHDFLRYFSSGETAGWDSIDSSAVMEFTFSSDKMRLLIESAQSIISEHFPTLNVPTTYLEVIDCLNTLFDPSQGYASHTSPIIPLILCQLIILADTAKEVKIENGSDVQMFKYDVQTYVNLSQKRMDLICFSTFASQMGGDTLIENRTDDVYYVLSGHWTI